MIALLPTLAFLSAAPRVAEVVVYPDRAQVSRRVETVCGARTVAVFEELSPAADPASFRARSQTGQIQGLRVEELARSEAFAPRLRELEARIHELERQLATQRDAHARAENAARLGAAYQSVAVGRINEEMAVAAPNVKGWSTALDRALETRVQAAADAGEAQARARELEERLEALRREQARLRTAGERRDWRAEVLVKCAPGRTTEVELTYLVGGASWEPLYQARADDSGRAIELSTFASVRQSTGEDWKGTRLILSTATPRQNATPPELQPLKVWADERKAPKKVIVRREEVREHAQAGEAGSPDGEDGMAARSQGLSVQLQVPEPADVPADGSPVRLFVSRQRMKAQLTLRSAPKQAPLFFRVAELTNSAPFPLLPGALEVFRAGAFIGRYPLERVAQGARFRITFGIEDGLKITRTTVAEVSRETGLFGGNRRFRYAYRFELQSFRQGDEEVHVSEHVPVSELEDVQVELDPRTTAGYALDPEDGIVTWKLKLGRGEARSLELAYHVDVPSSYDSGGM